MVHTIFVVWTNVGSHFTVNYFSPILFECRTQVRIEFAFFPIQASGSWFVRFCDCLADGLPFCVLPSTPARSRPRKPDSLMITISCAPPRVSHFVTPLSSSSTWSPDSVLLLSLSSLSIWSWTASFGFPEVLSWIATVFLSSPSTCLPSACLFFRVFGMSE